jgi:hypothetical protein
MGCLAYGPRDLATQCDVLGQTVPQECEKRSDVAGKSIISIQFAVSAERAF